MNNKPMGLANRKSKYRGIEENCRTAKDEEGKGEEGVGDRKMEQEDTTWLVESLLC